jgi:hypothetical protein
MAAVRPVEVKALLRSLVALRYMPKIQKIVALQR